MVRSQALHVEMYHIQEYRGTDVHMDVPAMLSLLDLFCHDSIRVGLVGAARCAPPVGGPVGRLLLVN